MKRLSWSKLFNLAALASLGLVTFSPANAGTTGVADRAPNTPISARIPGVYPSGSNPQAAPNTRAIFEGPNATDYFNFAQTDSSLANPEVAVGPEDIVMVVNRQIFRVPNGNAPGVAPTVLNPLFTGSTVSQKAFLDNWIGETALNQLCPTGSAGTGVTRTSATCQIDNASVKYDQMHGRFLVLFTVVDTGLTPDASGQNYFVTRPRKASWVLIVSRTSVLTDTALFDAAGNPLNPNAAGTKVFETPTPGGAAVTGGLNPASWAIYFGNDVAALGSDGFGSNKSFAGVGVGNINSLPGIAGSSASFDCSPGAVAAAGALPSNVCYLPTGARLGIDNDTITIVSPVVNGNINSANLSPFNNPVAGAGLTLPGYAGNRIRVLKKSAIYTFKVPLAAGNQFATGAGFNAAAIQAANDFQARAVGDYYDLYTNDGTGVPVANTGGTPIPYTAVLTATNSATSTSSAPTAGSLAPLFYEPAHLRGRAMATFSNQPMLGAGGRQQSQTYLVGAVSSSAVFSNALYIQGIIEVQNPVVTAQRGPLPFYPILENGTVPTQEGVPVVVAVSAFANPGTVPQQGFRTGGAAPNLFVGDDRPQKVIFREGHLYDARVAFSFTPGNQFTNNPTATLLSSTVAYDIVQKLHNSFAPLDVLQAQWQNTNAYAPMYDVPANVSLQGQISPINTLPYLEKLFVATTYPPLVSQDPLFAGVTGGDPRSREDSGSSGVPLTQLPAMANCFNNQQVPGSSVTGTGGGTSFIANNALAWPGLFDIRCGMDPADSNPSVRNPASGVFQAQTSYTIRGSAATDPNDGSLWNFGAYSRKRNASVGTLAHWGTFGANYKLSFPTVDPYGNSNAAFSDIVDANGNPTLPEYPYIQMAALNGLSPTRSSLTPPNAVLLPFAGVNSTLYPTPPAVGNAPGTAPAAGTFGPNDAITRREMAAWIVKSQMDEGAITDYLNATSTINGAGAGGAATSFADVPSTDPGYRYIEVMARRGYTSGCAAGVALRYCPDYIATRKDLAVFMIRAKFSNVFGTVLSGCSFGFVGGTTSPTSTLFPPALTTSCGASTGDNFGLFVTGLTYFTDNPAVTGNDEYVFIQKMRELRITNGTYLGPNSDGRNGTYTRGAPAGPPANGDPGSLLRKQVAVFMVRGFFL